MIKSSKGDADVNEPNQSQRRCDWWIKSPIKLQCRFDWCVKLMNRIMMLKWAMDQISKINLRFRCDWCNKLPNGIQFYLIDASNYQKECQCWCDWWIDSIDQCWIFLLEFELMSVRPGAQRRLRCVPAKLALGIVYVTWKNFTADQSALRFVKIEGEEAISQFFEKKWTMISRRRQRSLSTPCNGQRKPATAWEPPQLCHRRFFW